MPGGQARNITKKKRKGAYWEDRYHATAAQDSAHLIQCLNYIDMNMVRAGVVEHPREWNHCGYNEIQEPRKRYRLIDHKKLMRLLNFQEYETLKSAHSKWTNDALKNSILTRENHWTQSIAVMEKVIGKYGLTKI